MFLAAMLLALPSARAADRADRSDLFPRPAAIESQVRFWRAIFTDYSERQVVLHDAFDLDKVYAVLDFRPQLEDGMSPGEVDRLQRVSTDVELDHLRATLRRLSGARPEDLSAADLRIYNLFRDDPSPDRFLEAADEKHLRSQRGLRERFSEGLRMSHRYLPEMERIFREEGLPVALTRLPLIESCFNVNAYSKLGAAGVWQFMPSTGRLFMRVGDTVDERRDPIAATRGAARFLRGMYDDLGAWPLAITGWNHGPDGVARAVRTVGTRDIGRIVHEYRGSSFGFASRNFYAEFIAALDVDDYREAYFGHQAVVPLPRAREYPLERPVGIEVAARLARTDKDTLAEMNPALMDPVVEGRRLIPAGYHLRIPESGAGFDARLAEFAAETHVTRVAAPAPPTRVASRTRAVASRTHKVANGQTLSHIAKRYKVTVASLRTANRLGRSGTVRAGQVLRIPRST
jgi:membrane-bound lytic murein transglycosylase D